MTIGKSSKKNKAPKSPPFLDCASGFYERLDEFDMKLRTGVEITEKLPTSKPGVGKSRTEGSTGSSLPDKQDHGVLDFEEGMMEDDGMTLLKRKPSRLSQRWSRKGSKRSKSDKPSVDLGSKSLSTKNDMAPSKNLEVQVETQSEMQSSKRASDLMVVHFSVTEYADDKILITERKEEHWEMEGKTNPENMKVMKRSSFRHYGKVLDKALRRGWETFVANLNSVTLAPVSTSSSSPSKSEMDRKSALADFR
ncbi:uncharacterized protein sb:cb1058 isoform X1 [Trichomycterus rosablanca]|uniref:uncharacterized protein sb:cb1058 isoform X1 n=1 Tax=Trichomycterus rosablanca TaxID=2290929 RepID=UPI002F352C4E